MSTKHIGASYAKSLVWCAVLFGLAVGISNIVELIFVDFMHENPYRTQQNASMMMLIFTPALFMVAFLGVFLIFSLPQIFQANITKLIAMKFGSRYDISGIAILPITAVVTWYCYDYLTPTDCNLGINAGPDWSPYQHGLTLPRYLKTLALQAPVTIFSYFYVKYRHSRSITVALLVLFFVLAATGGAVHGYYTAK